jgi:outer membrane beta-barrel protein
MQLLPLLFLIALFSAPRVMASERSLYDFVWLDPDKKVYVLQNKLFKKERTGYVDVGYISNFTSRFQDTQGVQVKAGYYFHEEWGLEGFFNHYSNSDNEDYKGVQVLNEQVPFVRRLNQTYGLVGIWSPFYGKINTFNRIFYFDLSFGAGLARIGAESNLRTTSESIRTGNDVVNRFDSESFTGGILKTNLKLHLSRGFFFSLGYMNTYYQAASPRRPNNKELKVNSDMTFSLGFSI